MVLDKFYANHLRLKLEVGGSESVKPQKLQPIIILVDDLKD